MRVRKALSWSGLSFAALKALMALCSRGVAATPVAFAVTGADDGAATCASAAMTKQKRNDADVKLREQRSMGVLAFGFK
jgi:hypothetical protein